VIAAQLIAGGRLVAGLFSINFEISLLLVAVVFTLYTFWGGQLSVLRTDAWQLFLFVGGLFVSLIFLMLSRHGTVNFWGNIPDTHWDFPVSPGFGWYDLLVFYPLIVGLPYLVGPDMYSRILCAKDHRVAKKSALLAAMAVIPLSFLLAVLGLLARAHFPDIAAEAALPKTLTTLMPMGLRGLIVAGFLGAIMSSADTCLISASTILTLNVVRPFYDSVQQRQLQITRAIVLLLGVAAWFIASRQQGIISSLLLGYKVFVGGVVIPTLATFFQKHLRLTSAGALWAIVMGGGIAILGNLQGGAPLKTVLTPHGQALLNQMLGAHYLSFLPIIVSILIVIGFSQIRRAH
jgi:SSS family solute:Na+ symporter